ncbi:MAG: zf-HC2 domain-containing protein [Candidatus Limnocylindria bacterium]
MDQPHDRDTRMASGSDPLACIELVELVTEYLDDVVSPADQDRIELHLSGCDDCTTYLEQMRQTIAATGQISTDDVPQSVVDQLLAVFRASRRTGS